MTNELNLGVMTVHVWVLDSRLWRMDDFKGRTRLLIGSPSSSYRGGFLSVM